MTERSPDTLAIAPPSLPKGGGAIQSIGKSWGAVGPTGAATLSIPLPLSPGRGYAPELALQYGSNQGNGPFGMGWSLPLPGFTRRTVRGAPAYLPDDEILGPGGDILLVERDAHDRPVVSTVTEYGGLVLPMPHQVSRYQPRVESSFDRIECWTPERGVPFWLVHGADGSLSVFGKRAAARVADQDDPAVRVAEWWLEESVNPYGEHILYDYLPEDGAGAEQDGRDTKAQRYLSAIRYGNARFHAPLYLWDESALPGVTWHFEAIIDYGERATAVDTTPAYRPEQSWPRRADAYSRYAYGFEIRTLRLCRQVLMFHHFPAELGPDPALVRRLLLEYDENPVCSQLVASHAIAYDALGQPAYLPPLEFAYGEFSLARAQYRPFDAMPGLNDGELYQLVDLYGEGLPGVLYRQDQAWLYREPQRATSGGDDVAYSDWTKLPVIPVADRAAPPLQTLADLTGNGRLDWLVAQVGLTGFFSLEADRQWSRFLSFTAFPLEFFHPQGQLADLMGAGLSDLALIGPCSVRLYANQGAAGYAAAREVPHTPAEDMPLDPLQRLPLISDGRSELVAFSDVLGSGQQHLIRLRHDGLTCWPNLGRGRFGRALAFSVPFPTSVTPESFDAACVRLADLDGSGATDVIYLQSEHALIFMNRGGQGFDPPYALPWPAGVRYDHLCQASVADLDGLGCSSLVLSVPHMQPRHWRCDIVHGVKPYLLQDTNNNMGAAGHVRYRSSAQEWLDEKQECVAARESPVCELPFPIHVAVEQRQHDEITGNTLTQRFQYRQGYYDGADREFRGFGCLRQIDSELPSTPVDEATFPLTSPALTKTWFHTGSLRHDASRRGFDTSDALAVPLGATLLTELNETTKADEPLDTATLDDATRRALARSLTGRVRRVEMFGLDQDERSACPYAVTEHRYLVRRLQPCSTCQRDPVLLPLPLESIAYAYERLPGDPTCQHTIQLRWDIYGALTHGVQINYARRWPSAPPFEDAHEQIWWRASFDTAQEHYYLTESLSEFAHLDHDPQAWRLGVPYRARTNTAVVPGAAVQPDDLCYERVLAPGSPFAQAPRVLSGLVQQHYQSGPDNRPSFEALLAYTETAELDETALQAYAEVLPDPAERDRVLAAAGYHRMAAFLPDVPSSVPLWSIHSQLPSYATPEHFRKVVGFQATRSHPVIRTTYDPYDCLPIEVIDPASGTTTARYDYRHFLPVEVVDPNHNTQQALYDAFGRLIANGFHGTELGQPERVGFDPIDTYVRPFEQPEQALAAPRDALQGVAAAYFYDPFSWMGTLPAGSVSRDVMQAQRWITCTGHIRASAWRKLEQQKLEPALAESLRNVVRSPVHSAALQADHYPGDPAWQARIGLTYTDGFGRALQSKQKVEPGDAYTVDEYGGLVLAPDGQPQIHHAERRWVVSARVEYNHKGLAVRVYRPYFADSHRYIHDEAFRRFGYSDRQFYDPLSRPIRTLTAKGYLRRQTYWPWYVVSEDENDTAAEDDALPATLPASTGE
jgi:hypothetical protein